MGRHILTFDSVGAAHQPTRRARQREKSSIRRHFVHHHAAVSSVVGVHFATWLGYAMGGAMVRVGGLLFLLAWLFSPSQGLVRPWLRGNEQARLAGNRA